MALPIGTEEQVVPRVRVAKRIGDSQVRDGRVVVRQVAGRSGVELEGRADLDVIHHVAIVVRRAAEDRLAAQAGMGGIDPAIPEHADTVDAAASHRRPPGSRSVFQPSPWL